MTGWLKYLAKAIYSTLVSVAGGVTLALQSDNDITGFEWLNIGLAGAIAGVGVWAISNGEKPGVEKDGTRVG
jgi:hypothetical protein